MGWVVEDLNTNSATQMALVLLNNTIVIQEETQEHKMKTTILNKSPAVSPSMPPAVTPH